eukprot:186232_1
MYVNMDEYYQDLIPLNCSITPQQMKYRSINGSKTFKEIINQSSQNVKLLLNPANWSIIVDYIYHNTSYSTYNQKLNLLTQLKELAENSMLKPDKYRIIKQNDANKMKSHAPGFCEFVQGLGFKGGIYDHRLVMVGIDELKINTAISAVEHK